MADQPSDASNRRRGLAVLVLPLVLVGGCALFWVYNPIYYKNVAERYRRQMATEADIPAIQAWVATLKPTSSGQFESLSSDQWPQCIKNLKTDRVGWDGKWVWVFCGGGFGHWGMKVSVPGTPIPESSSREYCLPLADGAYIFHEIQ